MYQLKGVPELQKRLDEMVAVPEPQRLENELGVARWQCEIAINAGDTGLATRLLDTIQKLSSAMTAAKIRGGELLDKTILFSVIKKLLTILDQSLREMPSFVEADWYRVHDAMINELPKLLDEEMTDDNA